VWPPHALQMRCPAAGCTRRLLSRKLVRRLPTALARCSCCRRRWRLQAAHERRCDAFARRLLCHARACHTSGSPPSSAAVSDAQLRGLRAVGTSYTAAPPSSTIDLLRSSAPLLAACVARQRRTCCAAQCGAAGGAHVDACDGQAAARAAGRAAAVRRRGRAARARRARASSAGGHKRRVSAAEVRLQQHHCTPSCA
jgi:hypothetical protein